MSKILNFVFLAFAFMAIFSAAALAAEEATTAAAAPAAVVPKKGGGAMIGVDGDLPADASVGGGDKKVRAPRSLLQACRKEINKVCPEKKAIVKCLSTKVDQIEDAECKTWVVARDVCTKAASKSAKCTTKDSPRQCLRKVSASDLPEECTKSDFYKSVKMFSMFRKNPGKSGLLGKLQQK